ncbi:MAG: replication initiation protein [Ruminococcus flavefaciens]|nr:replication initiation protein [Ruminococcus flavefaciens]MCM1061512.1 replication initiation protein [Eubacterium sp.]
MPRKKTLLTLPDYEGLARNPENMLVQKSNPLQSLSETQMTLPEFKILDAYLSRINSHKPEERYVRFEKGELEQLLGVSRILKEDLNKRLKNLFQVVTIKDKTKRNGFKMIALFEKAEAFQDDNGLWQVDLACTPSAMEYIFNIENMGYLPYMLKNVIELTSRYSYVLFLYFENNRFRKTWTEPLDKLKATLRCTGESYNQYKVFNDRVLKLCYKELNDKTDTKFSYEPIKSGRKVIAIRFTLKTQADEDTHQLTLADLAAANGEEPDIDAMEEKYGSEQLAQLAEPLEYAFTKEQMEEIFSILCRIDVPPDRTTNSILWGRTFYLREKYAALKVEEAKKAKNGEHIKNRYAYFKKMLEQDTYTPVAYV